MALVIQKYGGTSVANIANIEMVAQKVIKAKESGNQVVVVLSAMAGETDRLISLAHQVADDPDEREYDALISTGEQITVTLLAMMLNKLGYKAKSFLGFQAKILTDQAYKKARILSINAKAIKSELKKGTIVVIAGRYALTAMELVQTIQHSDIPSGVIRYQRRCPGGCLACGCL